MANFDIKGTITYDAHGAVAGLSNAADAQKKLQEASNKANEALEEAQEQFEKSGDVAGLAAGAIGQVSPALGGIVDTAGQATVALSALSTAGFGPLGTAIAAVSIVVTTATGLWAAFSDAQAEAKNKADELKKSIDAQVESLDDIIARNAEIAGQQERARRIAAGGGTEEELRAQVERAEQLVRAREQAMLLARGGTFRSDEGEGPGFLENVVRGYEILGIAREQTSLVSQLGRADDIRLAQNQLNAATRSLATARAQLADAEQRGFRTIEIEEGGAMAPGSPGWLAFARANNLDPRTGRPLRSRGGGGGGGGGAATGGPAAPSLDELMARAGTPTDRAFGLEGLDLESLAAQDDEWMKAQDDAAAKRLEAERLQGEEKNRLAQELADERLRIEEELNGALLESVQSALAASVDAWLSGSQSIGAAMQDMVKSIAKSLASEAIIQGLKETALGIGALAGGSPTAALHFAAAGKWAAVGVAAGLVGAATGAFGGGGGGGAPAAATGGPALTAGAGEGAGTTVVINWGSSGLVYAADRAQLGRDISGMISEAHGRLGRGM